MKKMLALLLVLVLVLMVSCALAESTDLAYESRGIYVPATLVIPDDLESYPMVVFIHGMGGNRDEEIGFEIIAGVLAAKGIGSIRMDLPGCGESMESFRSNTLSNIKADVTAAIDFARENTGMTKLGMFGYSMGGRALMEMLVEGVDADAICLLAPAAANAPLVESFGGEEGIRVLYEIAARFGFVLVPSYDGKALELSREWFDDLRAYENIISAARDAYSGPAMVIWSKDDLVVSPEISAAVAIALDAEMVDASGNGHGYGFYDENYTLCSKIASKTADFFDEHLN